MGFYGCFASSEAGMCFTRELPGKGDANDGKPQSRHVIFSTSCSCRAGWRQLQTTVWKPLCDSLGMALCRHMVSSPLKEVWTLSDSCLENSSVDSVVETKMKRRWTSRCNSCLKLFPFIFCVQKAPAWRKLSPVVPVYSGLCSAQQKGKALSHGGSKISVYNLALWDYWTVQSLLDWIALLLPGILEHQKWVRNK